MLPFFNSTEKFQGNFGLLDMIGAMEWSQKYVPYFGGNISDATISGCRSGGEAVWWLLTIEQAWPYFNKANIMGMGFANAELARQAQVRTLWNKEIFIQKK